ncbi:hypothetical protein TNCV_3262391 [Trichonephila clavipes]|nr:hypothetical protein TNCV_3262391 [Trichonephila clavipes]
MSKMETDTMISIVEYTERLKICAEINHNIFASYYQGLDKLPDTAENQEMKEILRAALEETLRKKADLVKPSIKKAKQDSNNSTDNTSTSKITKPKAKGKNKKRKIKKDSSEDFVCPKKTARPVSPLLTPNSQSKPLTLSEVPATPLVTDTETTPTNFIHARNTWPTLFPDKGRRDMSYPSAFHSYKGESRGGIRGLPIVYKGDELPESYRQYFYVKQWHRLE